MSRTGPACVVVPGGFTARALLALICVAGVVVTADAQRGAAVVKTGDMTVARWNHTATLLADGRVLIAGGDGMSSAEIFDPATGTFTRTPPMRYGRRAHTATLLRDGTVLIAGGGTDGAEIFDPELETFRETGRMISPQLGHTAMLLADGKVLIAGGLIGEAPKWWVAAPELYDPATGTFSHAGSYASPGTIVEGGPVWPSSNLLPDGRVLITGGNPAEVFDPTTGTFSFTGHLVGGEYVFGMYWHQATTLKDGSVLVTGGNDDWTCSGFRAAEVFDPASGHFRSVESMKQGRDLHTSTLLEDGRVMIAGGGSGWCRTNTTAVVEIYDPATESFVVGGSMSEPRAGHTATLLPDGRVLVAGGFSYWPRKLLRSAEIHQPAIPVARTRGVKR